MDTWKILWHSNAPWVGTGYGNQTHLFTSLLAADGHEVYISAYWGLKGHRLRMNDQLSVLPGGLEDWGNDVLSFHCEEIKPDVLFMLHDIWVIQDEILDKIPATSWCPVDHKPAPPMVVNKLSHCRHVVAMSKFGEMELRKAGLDPFYIPHGVSTESFYPLEDRDKARELCSINEDTFYVVINAANKGYPSRKSFESIFKAWGIFIKNHPEAVLYIHAIPFPIHGLDLLKLAEFYKISENNLQFPDTYRLLMGDFDWDRLNIFYNAADAYLAPSMGEGFGIPVIEAQSAGCPVIVSDFTAQTELCAPGGYLIPVADEDLVFTPQYSEQALIHPNKILDGLEYMYEHRADHALRQNAREFAMQYNATHVYKTYMLPVFEQIAGENA